VPEPGPPGSGTFSGNPVLSAWYDYNPRTHEVTPRPVAFVVCTADGGVARLRISGYGQGVMSLEYTYAGDDTTF